MTISLSRFIYFTCLHTSFLVQRDHTFWADQMFFTPQDIFYRYNFTITHACISNFMFHKSTPVLIFLSFTYKSFFPQFYHNIIFHRYTLCQQHEAIILSYFTQSNIDLTFRDYCGRKLLKKLSPCPHRSKYFVHDKKYNTK
jgi:hypothetical protein